jgi:hypothetical protein
MSLVSKYKQYNWNRLFSCILHNRGTIFNYIFPYENVVVNDFLLVSGLSYWKNCMYQVSIGEKKNKGNIMGKKKMKNELMHVPKQVLESCFTI